MIQIPDLKEFLKEYLVLEAKRWVGVKEIGTNGGQIVGMFQNWDNSPDQVPWCLAFVQYCLKQTVYTVDVLTNTCNPWHCLPATEHCMTAWARTPEEFKSESPSEGSIVIWAHYRGGKPTGSGHCGIVTKVHESGRFETVEGNTHAGAGIQREGDGVYERVRSVAGSENFVLLGFILPWG